MDIKQKQLFLYLTKKNQKYIHFLKSRIAPHIPQDIANKMIEYSLSKKEHIKALNNIKADIFKFKNNTNQKIIHLVISQSGGGKTNLTKFIQEYYKINIKINSDELKKYNPLNSLIIENYPNLYNYLTGLDAYLFRDEIYNEALSMGYNIIIEITPSTNNYFFNVDFNKLISKGYRIEAHILAVSKYNSIVSMYERYEKQLQNNYRLPKIPDITRATDSYNAMNFVVEKLSKLSFINVNIYKRGETENSFPILISNPKEDALSQYISTENIDFNESIKTIKDRINNIISNKHIKKKDCNNLIISCKNFID